MDRSFVIRCVWTILCVISGAQLSLGNGNPVLLVTSSSNNAFSSYTSEILRAEGLAFDTADLANLNSATLAPYDVVVLGQVQLSATQVTTLTTWVNGGGRLVALRPDKQLAPLLGLTDTGTILTNGYLLVNTAAAPGAGIVGQTIQFHGTADLYTLNGATNVATLYSDASTPTSYPAVSVRTGIGTGIAAAFTYDLAKSVVYTRQGNPLWASQARVQQGGPIRAGDMFYGPATFDYQADWIDFNKVAIPQADEQQRLLVNLVVYLSQGKKPIPRFWYLPFGKKAAVVMTGDDHGNNGTAGRFDYFNSVSPSGCSVDNWECVRASSYIYPNTPITGAQAAAYVAQGFEIGVHVNTGCADYTPSTIESVYATELADFAAAFPGLPPPVTNRTHCIAWSDWDSQAFTERAHGIRLDTNYYYWPGSWVQDRPGFFTGSGIPMRFARQSGETIDIYQAATQLTDESAQSFPLHINSLLDGAVGANGYYGVFTANMHTDYNNDNSQLWSEQIVSAAQARGVPVVSAKQMLQWLNGRDASAFSNISWSGNVLTFSVAAASGANGLQGMLPTVSPSGGLTSLARGGSPVSYTVQTIKGVEYAFFNAASGSYTATYATPLPPVISAVTAVPGTNNVTITWTTDKPSSSRVDYGVSAASLTSNTSNSALVTNHSLVISGLNQAAAYYFRVTSTSADSATATSPATSAAPASFTTLDPTPPVISAVTTASNIDGTVAISWITNKLSSTRVDYGTSPTSLTLNVSYSALVTAHNVNLTGLTFGATYYYRVTSTDSLGNSSTFPVTTSNPASFTNTPQLTIWNPAAIPTVIDSNEAAPLEVGLKFRSDVAAQVTGVRFYKAPGNIGTHVGHLWTISGVLLSSVTFTNESASGWQQANFAAPVSIAANTTYIVSCFMPNGHYSADTGYFTSQSVDSAPLHALREGIDGSNGVFVYASAPSFPTGSWNSANYWVDLSITTDNLPPVISAVSSSTTATTASITWTTNKNATSRVDYGTSAASLTQNVSDGSLTTSHSVTISGLTAGTTYYFRVTSVDGQGLTATSPAIVNAPASFVPADTVPPIISAVTATPGAVTATISWTTNESSTSRVDYGLAPGSLTLSASDPALLTGHSVTVSGLSPTTTYYYQVTSVDAFGNTSTSPVGTTASFTTVDNIPPVISSVGVTPGVGGTATVTWTTSKPSNSRIDYGTTANTLNLNVTSPALVAAHTVVLAGLQPGTTYYLRVSSTDSAGNSATSPAAPDPPVTYLHTGRATIWSTSSAPAVVDSNDAAGVQLGLKFRSDTAGVVYGLRFYKAEANTGAHIGNLWTSTGTLLGSVNFANETASGWQQADFSTPIAIDANTTYVVSYYAPNGHYSFTTGLFGQAGVDNLPLHALAEGVDGGNGVFAYGSSNTFPNQAYNSTSYWVDVVFSEDTLPPVISSVTAAPTETGAIITWTTSKLANSRVDFGTTAGTLSQNVSNTALTTSHSLAISGLTSGTAYYFRVTSVDSQGISATAPTLPSAPLSFTTSDTTPPVLSSITATPGSTSATINWSTNENATSRVDYGTSPSTLNLHVSDASLVTAHSLSLPALASGVTYYYTVTSTDASFNTSTGPIGTPASFATADINPPIISSVVVTPNANGTATVTWTTNKLSNSRVDYGTSSGSLSLNVADATMVIAHSIVLPNLVGGTTYYFRVTSTDSLGNRTTSPVTVNNPASFGQPNFLTIWSSSVTPTTVDAGDASAVELGAKFRTDSPGAITGVRFYKAPSNIGPHVGNLWSSSGTLLGSAVFTNETSSGWQQANFTSPITITPDTTYVVSYFAPVGHYSVNSNFFTAGVDNGVLHALANGVDGGNGVFQYGSTSAFPNSTHNASNYWVDVVFAESTGAPVITAVTAVTASTSATVTWKTNKLSTSRVDYGTSPSNLNLSLTDNTMVTAHSMTLTGLTTGTTYYYRVTSADAQGFSTTSPLITNPAASFIPSAPAAPRSIWTSSAIPGQIDSNDTTPVELGLKFRSDVSGYVTGVRFYKSIANIGTHIGNLWSSTGTNLGKVTFTGETASGWQQATFATPVPISANTTYVVSYFAPFGHYSDTEDFFTTTGVDAPPLHALQNGVDGPNGVYQYSGTSAFPNSTYISSNYWVDLVFVSNDAVPPTVTSFTLPSTSSSLVVAITSLTATDNIGVAGYLVTESSTRPDSGNIGWTISPPTSYAFSSAGSKTLYAWAKDASQNVSASRSAPVTITLTDTSAPSVTAFSIPSTASSLTVPITTFVATDNTGVAGYLVNETATIPSPGALGWTSTVPMSYTFQASGIRTLYAWAKDAAGNVSTSRTAIVAITLSTDGPEPAGWYSGDIHVHRSCGGSPESVTSLLAKMGVNNLAAISLLADNGNGEVQNPVTDLPLVNPQDDPASTANRIIHWDVEWHWDAVYTQYPHQALGGHLVALGLNSAQQIWDESTYSILNWARTQNGIAGFAHLQYLPSGIPDSLTCCTPIEYPVEVALGSADFISEDVDDSGSGIPMNPDNFIQAYYKLLNSGFRPGFAAGTDYPCNSSRPLGALLTYAQPAAGQMTYRNWIEAIKNGRTVVSRNGHNEFLNVIVNGTATSGDQVNLASAGSVGVTVQWSTASNMSGTLELVSNGVVVASSPASASQGAPATWNTTINFPKSGWLAARRMGVDGHQVHTAAVFVIVNGAPIRASVDDAQFYVDWMDNLLTKTAPGGEWNSFYPTQLPLAQSRYQQAKALFQQRALEAAGGTATPTLTSITPASGAPGATVPVTIIGTNLASATLNLPAGITISGTPGVTATQITASLVIASNATSGARSITVTASGGTSNAVIFTVNTAAPTLTGINPTSGARGATIPVTITGTNLLGATLNLPTGITASGSPAVTATQITATLVISSSATTGTRTITVTTSGGASNSVSFTVASAPALTSITPSSGARGATIPVTIVGTNLLGASLTLPSGITLSGTPTITATQITANLVISSSATTGARSITATTGGSTSNSVTFTVASAPSLTSITPSSGARGATIPVTIVGTNLLGTSLTLPSGITLSGTPTITATQITANLVISSSATTGARSITATTGGSTSNSVTFTVASAPALTSITPSSGARGATIPVTIVGTNLLGTSLTLPSGITLSGTPTITNTQITTTLIISSSAATGARSIAVTNGGSTSNSLTFTVAAAPALTSITPSSGFQGATVPVTIAGTNLIGTSLTLPSGVTLSGTPTITATQITASLVIASNATTGVRTITATTGSSTSNSVNFTVNVPTPTLTAISPSSGTRGATVPVTITGTNLTGATLNLPSGITLSGTPTVTSTQITATLVISSSSATGARSISATTTFGTSNNLTFTVTLPPAITSISPSAISRIGTTTVTINGSNFTSTTTASVSPSSGISVGSITFVSASQIRFPITTLFASTGARSLTVTAGGQTSNAVTLTIQ